MHSVWVTKAFHDPCIGRSLIKEGSLYNKKFYVLLNIVYFGSESAYLWHYRINNFISREFAFNWFKINFGLGQTLLTLMTYCPTDCMYEQSFCKWVYCLSVDFFKENHSWIYSIEFGAKIFHVIIRKNVAKSGQKIRNIFFGDCMYYFTTV